VRRVSSVVFSLELTIFLLGCGPPEPTPSGCRTDVLSTDAPSFDVQLGTRQDGAYVPWSEGEQLEVINGGQGAVMVVPRVRIPDAPADATDRCMRVELDNVFDYGMGPFPTLALDETFRVIDGGWESVSLEVPLDYGDVDMHTITFTATVRSETFTAEGTLMLELLGPT
jgi:hypothetical protein